MASSATVVPLPPPKPSNPDNDVDDEDYDIVYEEIEEEVEVEEEFEVEVDEEDELEAGDGEIGEDLTPVRDENQVIDMGLEDSEEHLQSGSMTRGLSVSNPLNEIRTTQEDVAPLKTSESCEKEELLVNGDRTSGGDAPKSPLCGSEKVNQAERTPLVGEDQDYHASLIMTDPSRVEDNTGDANHTVTKALADIRQMSPRSNVSLVRIREPSLDAEFHSENKKLRIICEFHAKGWCIKGNSCRFLHIKDGLDDVVKKNEPLERQASSSGFVLPLKSEENLISNCETDYLYGGRSSFGHNLYKDNYRYSYGNFSGDDHHISRLSAFGTTVGEMISKKNGMVPTDLISAELPYSLSRRPLSLGLSSWNTDALGIHNLCKSDLDCHASASPSLKQNISSNPCSELEILLRNRVYRDKKLSSDCWELSVPFRPSHDITRNLLMKENLYDPIRDMEQIGDKDRRMEFSHSDHGVQSNSFLEDGKLLDTVEHNKNMKLSSSSDNKLRFEEQRFHKETDGHSKALKHFQAELIKFVKELVRPTWHKRLLSREAHKVIVKKVADKVISTLQPQNIPCTDESIKSYFSSSLPKLEKLVEAYIEKYGKARKAE